MKPISDDTMIYLSDDKRYVLTNEYVLNKTGIDLTKVLNPAYSSNPQSLAENTLDQISIELYNWIYSHNANNDLQEYYLATNEELRTVIRDALLQQVLYILKNGDLNLYCGVNLKNGAVIEQNKLLEASISPLAKNRLNKQIRSLGVPITYQGVLRYPYGMKREEY